MSNASYGKMVTIEIGEGDESPFSVDLPSAVRVETTLVVPGPVQQRRRTDEEEFPYDGATVKLSDDSHLEVTFDGGPLQTGESIKLHVNLLDLDSLANSLLELDFKMLRTLGYLSENQLVDKVGREFGNQKTYRIRLFSSKAAAVAATPDIADDADWEPGEIARTTRNADIDVKNNDRDSMLRTLDKLADTPGIETEE